MVSGVDVHADSDPSFAGMQHGPDRAQGLSQDHACSSMQEPERLGVPDDRHPGDDPLGCRLEELDSHLLAKCAAIHGAHCCESVIALIAHQPAYLCVGDLASVIGCR